MGRLMFLLSLDAIGADLIETLSQAQVRFVIVGGVAVNIQGYKRPVHDLDVLSEPTQENAAKLAAIGLRFACRP